ncbi:MAG: selenide, water dikinase SelD [Bacteroidales bacterium]|nr:selenide, water dikinase SelD [Bacteroidales bacterium]
MIYLDYNATTPIAPEVKEAMLPFLDNIFGNPSSNHKFGIEARKAVENARISLSQLLHCQPEEIVFTSGGTESNNYAIKGVAFANQNRGKHIITSSVEHPAVMEVCNYLEKFGFETTYLPVDNQGMVNPESLKKAIRPDTVLVTIMHANNEVGTIQPISELAEIAKEYGITFHTDAAQSVGKIETDVQKLGVDLMSVAAHKFYGPKGIGALFIKTGIPIEKQMHGANHERDYRAGTENILEIAGLGKAAEIAYKDLEKNKLHFAKMRDLLQEKLLEELPYIKVNAQEAPRLPNTLSISIPKIEANTLLDELTEVAASAGAACHTDSIDVSVVLQAMQIPVEYAMGTIRFSTGRKTTEQEILDAATIFSEKIRQIRGEENTENQIITGEVKLTHFTHGMGCACKLRPQDLEQVLKDLPIPFNKDILVGTETSDDAAVYRLNENLALVQTLDFFTPIVDDPYLFGAIAAANALSDIYAMGAKPLFALNIVGFPDKRLPLSVLKLILKGAADKATEAGISILGGHTVEDTEPKYGMVVSGLVHPDKILRNIGAKDGDILILTKPLGSGIISTAGKRGAANLSTLNQSIANMAKLNKTAAEIAIKCGASACTDVTGFGLLGHLREMVMNTDVGVTINFSDVPFIEGVRELALSNFIPGGSQNNMQWVENDMIYADNLAQIEKLMLNDAQTSGGLLVAIPNTNLDEFVKFCIQLEQFYRIIGRFSNENAGKIRIEKH